MRHSFVVPTLLSVAAFLVLTTFGTPLARAEERMSRIPPAVWLAQAVKPADTWGRTSRWYELAQEGDPQQPKVMTKEPVLLTCSFRIVVRFPDPPANEPLVGAWEGDLSVTPSESPDLLCRQVKS